jgi:predicted HicB family RNase H-like nuclease
LVSGGDIVKEPRAEIILRVDPVLLKKITDAAAKEEIARNVYIVRKLKRTLPKEAV